MYPHLDSASATHPPTPVGFAKRFASPFLLAHRSTHARGAKRCMWDRWFRYAEIINGRCDFSYHPVQDWWRVLLEDFRVLTFLHFIGFLTRCCEYCNTLFINYNKNTVIRWFGTRRKIRNRLSCENVVNYCSLNQFPTVFLLAVIYFYNFNLKEGIIWVLTYLYRANYIDIIKHFSNTFQ